MSKVDVTMLYWINLDQYLLVNYSTRLIIIKSAAQLISVHLSLH